MKRIKNSDIDYDTMSVGEILATARMLNGYSIKDVTYLLNIGGNHLENLEKDVFNFVEKAYVVGYLRKYSSFLGLDSEILESKIGSKKFDNRSYGNSKYFQSEEEKKEESEQKPKSISVMDNVKAFVSQDKYRKSFISVIFSIVVIFSAIVFLQYINSHFIQSNADKEEYEKVENMVGVERAKTKESYVFTPWSKNVQENGSLLTLTFVEDSWIKIYSPIKREIYVNKLFKKGEIFKVPNFESIYMDIGNASQVLFKIKGYKNTPFSQNIGRPGYKISANTEDLIRLYNLK